ncbi:PIG-L deacetylase family protein [Halosimplex pelagicum]|uniref:PIG-L family deacetylase n=1 Tax=Halosimplex pelagicum TaxID=869886 RepID=A0A7D5SUD0_9EURY|nr:PIG-L family deacetylase [Halosimplex pelagicum]QLH81207.1 PIG-L family deacetylase [Halosimplex pelagicum]
MSVVVLAPHADDEVLGCGGTIRQLADDGVEVHLVIFTKGYEPAWPREHLEKRPDEIKAATEVLGIEDWTCLGFPSVKLDTVPQKEINDEVITIVESIQPETVFVPHPGDLNHDHAIVFDAGLVAARPHSGVDRILAYETLSESEWGGRAEQFDPTVYRDVSETLDIKVKAMHQYDSEVREFPHPRSEKAIRALARKRGSEAHFHAAEAFELIRERI